MLGLLGIVLGVAAFIGFEIYQQRSDERAINKAQQLVNQEIFHRQDKLGEQALENLREEFRQQELASLREQGIIDKYREQKELAGKLFNKASDDRLEALDAIAKLDKMLGSAEGEEYTLLTQKIEGLEKFAKTLEPGMEVLKEISLCDEDTEEGRDKIDYILSTTGTNLEELAQIMGIDL